MEIHVYLPVVTLLLMLSGASTFIEIVGVSALVGGSILACLGISNFFGALLGVGIPLLLGFVLFVIGAILVGLVLGLFITVSVSAVVAVIFKRRKGPAAASPA